MEISEAKRRRPFCIMKPKQNYLVRIWPALKRRIRNIQELFHDRWRRHNLGLNVAHSLNELEHLTSAQLMSVGRHEAHRIEKAFYNNGLNTKAAYYIECKNRLGQILGLLTGKHGYSMIHPVIQWMQAILDSYEDFGRLYVDVYKAPAPVFRPENFPEVLSRLGERRSCRVWASAQPSEAELRTIARQLIDAARWAPCSGNRQPWRFKIILEKTEKQLLRGLKEPHCLAAPLLIFIGVDRSVYGALGKNELGILIDGGAVVQQMIVAAHSLGLGTCWNHFARDLIYARPANPPRYRAFMKAMDIPNQIEPIAILAVGIPEYLPPTPARLNVDELLL